MGGGTKGKRHGPTGGALNWSLQARHCDDYQTKLLRMSDRLEADLGDKSCTWATSHAYQHFLILNP